MKTLKIFDDNGEEVFSSDLDEVSLAEAMMKPVEAREEINVRRDFWFWKKKADGKYYFTDFTFNKTDDPAKLRRIAATILWLANKMESEAEDGN